jgi:hypothetical protein
MQSSKIVSGWKLFAAIRICGHNPSMLRVRTFIRWIWSPEIVNVVRPHFSPLYGNRGAVGH